jgi:hypothetical protein
MLKRTTIEKCIGKTFADKVDDWAINASDQLCYTRREMIETIGCANFMAAARLEKVLKRLKIKTPKDLWNINPIDLLRSKGVGETSIFVAMCILDTNGFSVEEWWGWGGNVVKFSTFKHHAAQRASKRGKQDVA